MPSLDLKYTAIFYMAMCGKCDIRLPFETAEKRDEWTAIHDGIIDPFTKERHTVRRAVEIWED